MLVECMYSSSVLEVGLSQSTVSSPPEQWCCPRFWGIIKMVKMKYLVRRAAHFVFSEKVGKLSQPGKGGGLSHWNCPKM